MFDLAPSAVLAYRPKGRFHLMLVALVLYIFLIPAIEPWIPLKFLLDIFFSLVMVAAIYVVSVGILGFIIGVALALPMMVSIWLAYLVKLAPLAITGYIFAIFFMAYTIWVILRYILTQKKITSNIVSASIVVYLLLGITWALLYSLIHDLDPKSFAYGDLELGKEMVFFTYYSFITLTTLGFGDVTPVARGAVSLSALEAVVGQLYIAVLVARLVALQISHSKETP